MVAYKADHHRNWCNHNRPRLSCTCKPRNLCCNLGGHRELEQRNESNTERKTKIKTLNMWKVSGAAPRCFRHGYATYMSLPAVQQKPFVGHSVCTTGTYSVQHQHTLLALHCLRGCIISIITVNRSGFNQSAIQ